MTNTITPSSLTDSTWNALIEVNTRTIVKRPLLENEIHFAARQVLVNYGLIEVESVLVTGTATYRTTQAGKDLIAEKGHPKTVTFPEGYQTRVSAQTASRDYTGNVIPGTYELRYTDINYRPVREGERPYYVLTTVQMDVAERSQSTVEFGGVALASETIPAHREEHIISWYAYEVQGRLHAQYNEGVVYGY